MKKSIYTLFLSVITILSLPAQSGSRSTAIIYGQVIDGHTDDPMIAATVTITMRETGSILTGARTNFEGEFEIQVPFGVYDIVVSFIGYEEVRIDSVALGDDRPEFSLAITLLPSEISLGEVTIVSDKPVIENRFDKIVYNVSSDITSRGTLAIDVLRKVPHVTVDADGNVELQGNSNVRFLINGRTSSIFGNNLSDALTSIPASQIRSIEAITNPGAKYDLQGTGGVINIIMDDNRLQGLNGSVNLSAGTRNQTGSVNLGIKHGNFGVSGYFSGNSRMGTDASFSSVRETTDTLSGLSTSLVQSGLNTVSRNGYRAGTGFEWDISRKLSLSGSVGYNNFSFGTRGSAGLEETITNTTGALLSGLSTVRNFTNNRETGSIDWNLNLKKKFEKEGHELDFMFNSSYGRPVSYYILTLADIGDANPTEGSESNNPGTNNTNTASVDYVLPLNNKSTFEAGLKGTFNDITSSVDVNVYNPFEGEFIFDPLQSYDLGYILNVYAAYLSTGFRLFNWLDFKPGVRYEFSDISIDYPGASVSSYGTLVPSVLLSHNFTDKKSMQLTYTRRIRRPDYGDLNPFIDRSDPYNIQMGNVLLRPEVGERIELSYNTGFSKGGNLRVTLAQRIDSREIEDITTFYPEYVIGDSVYRNVSVTTNANIGSEYSSSLNIFTSIPVTSTLNLRSNMGLSHTYLSTDRPEGSFSTGFSFRGNLNATWKLPHELMLEGFGFWRSGGRGLQGREPPFYIYNLALRKLFWDDKGSVGVTATNFIRRDIRQVRTITTDNSFTRSIRNLPFRSFGISLTYRFGSTQSRPDRDDEMDSFGENGN